MKFAIPLANGRLCLHFGHCQQFALVNADEGGNLQTTLAAPPAHEPGALPRWLHEQGVEVVIAGGMGHHAQRLFEQNGVKVVVGAQAETPEKLVSAYLDGALQSGLNACDH
ncbi:MAG: NifB/NifX family molybdenum-iron cluster-binding protein [Pirellulales bacterium]|nr:NifB/NifX family molybdenum-iron cluster-binding protein [Pirellulales bacterium]